VDPLGVAIARAAEAPALVFADIDRDRLVHARKVLPVLENRCLIPRNYASRLPKRKTVAVAST